MPFDEHTWKNIWARIGVIEKNPMGNYKIDETTLKKDFGDFMMQYCKVRKDQGVLPVHPTTMGSALKKIVGWNGGLAKICVKLLAEVPSVSAYDWQSDFGLA